MPRLDILADTMLHRARASGSGHSAELIVHDGVLRQTVMGLRAGTELAEHEAPAAATLQVVSGRIRVLKRGQLAEELTPGELVSLTHSRHTIEALEDSVYLLTAVSGPPRERDARVA
jgi:quercetin dioxygenase-like cupin family protein